MANYFETLLTAAPGSVVTVEPDYIVVNDGVSYVAATEARSAAAPEKVLVIFDHNVPTGDPEGARVFGVIRDFAKKFGCKFIQAQGVGYQYMFNEVVKPGEIVIGGGSHSAIFGANGALGFNVSPLELARIIETGKYQLIVPETVTFRVEGKLKDGVSMMDAALTLLKNSKCIPGSIIKFVAPALSAHEKSVLCSMACGTGAVTAICVEKGETERVFDLATVEPMAVYPCEVRSAQNMAEIAPVASLAGTHVTADQIGGFTGGTIEDLRVAVNIIKGKKLARGFRLTICPATSADYIAACEEGLLELFIDYGAQISAAGDHSVVRQGAGVIGKGETLVTTGLYTYNGCMGVADSKVYTTSVETVACASFTRTL
jgi:3-isopropylmalate dehydratase large subunit 1